eukprot:2215421-Amphidinium_carterae.3
MKPCRKKEWTTTLMMALWITCCAKDTSTGSHDINLDRVETSDRNQMKQLILKPFHVSEPFSKS